MRATLSSSDQRGFTIVEVMVAIAILLVGLLGTVAMIDGANGATSSTRGREGATNLARELVEASRSAPYGKLAQATIVAQLQAQPGLSDSNLTDSQWTIVRRGFVYTVTADVCTLDDAKDGAGPHGTGVFCADAGAPGTADADADDYKRVGIEVRWDGRSGPRTVRQTALVGNSGTANGPPVATFTMTDPAPSDPSAPVVTTERLDTDPVRFSVTTAAPASTLSWWVDGSAQQSGVTGTGTSWTLSWPINALVDGNYLVSVRALDVSGAASATRTLTVLLNRRTPGAPSGLVGGHNGAVVELEWLRNSANDLAGYRAYRRPVGAETTDVRVCELVTKPTCRDTSPPLGVSRLEYYVRALDRDPSGDLREGPASTIHTVTTSNVAPTAPILLTATRQGDGSVTLDWTAATDLDGGVRFYRIYRDGTEVANRLNRTGGTEVTFTDRNLDGGIHTYYVTAVDGQLAESLKAGPVSG